MRIVAGSLKGRAILAPEGQNTRPTSDRARQAIFNVLEHASWGESLHEARVMDIYAGSGALGFEALSRGAAFAVFVEIDDGAAMTWMRQPHYYMGLYPYTYSIGLIAATALAEKSNRDGDVVLSQWLDVLRAGGTLPPLDLMRQVGIDLASPQPIRDAVAYVGRMIEELEGSF